MAEEFLSLLETIRAQEANAKRLYPTADGISARKRLASRANYLSLLGEAAKLVADVVDGHKDPYWLREAMTTSDFQILMGDLVDRQLMARYAELPQVYKSYVRTTRVRDFRTVKRLSVDGAEGVLSTVKEHEEYPESKVDDSLVGSYSVAKYGRRLPISWESLVNDDLNAFTDLPDRLARAARRTESKFATSLYVGTSGPDSTLFSADHKNIINTTNGASATNPALSITALQDAYKVIAKVVDGDSEPIVIDMVTLVVPPALEITAQNLLNAQQLVLDPNAAAGTANQVLYTANWLARKTQLVVDPYIPVIATSNGGTSWFMFANPNSGRWALEMGFLVGHETPEVFMRAGDSVRVGGGGADAMSGSFETDAIDYKVRHILGGGQMDYKCAVASNGTGS